jgi:hypothetical protein
LSDSRGWWEHILGHSLLCVYHVLQLVYIIIFFEKITHILSTTLHLHIKFQVQIYYILVITKKEISDRSVKNLFFTTLY